MKIPADLPLYAQAARSFHGVACFVEGIPPNKHGSPKHIADLIEFPPDRYTKARLGITGSLQLVARWIRRWNADHPKWRLELVTDGKVAAVRRVR